MIKVNYQGREVEAEEVGSTTIQDGRMELELEDGTNIRLRLVIGRILRLQGEKHPDGSLIYLVNNQIVFFTYEKGK